MSIHNIPDRYLNTTVHIFRESTVADKVGDLATSLNLAYASLKANIQPKVEGTEFLIQGRVHLQDHVAYINRVENTIIRNILIGDRAYDEESHITYMVLGIEVWQAANSALEDTHHLKLILKSTSGFPEALATDTKTVSSKAKIT
jgi:hypothetical protein